MDREEIKNQKILDIMVDELEQGLNIFENWNPLRVAHHSIADFIFFQSFSIM